MPSHCLFELQLGGLQILNGNLKLWQTLQKLHTILFKTYSSCKAPSAIHPYNQPQGCYGGSTPTSHPTRIPNSWACSLHLLKATSIFSTATIPCRCFQNFLRLSACHWETPNFPWALEDSLLHAKSLPAFCFVLFSL